MEMKKIRVKLVYRNYKPLHSIYQSLVSYPPSSVEYLVPEPNTNLKRLFKWYKLINSIPLLRNLVYLAESKLFLSKQQQEDIDIYHYVNMIDSKIPQKPYVVDIEHATGLISFSVDKKRIEKVKEFLQNNNCKSINCMSEAARKSLNNMLGQEFKLIENKTNVVYPAMPTINPLDFPPSDKYISKRQNTLDIVFVGNLAYLKGLEELLYAVKKLNNEYKKRMRLYVISIDGKEIVDKYSLANVYCFVPNFSHKEIIEFFYVPADLFILPTKSDTFGMALLDSLASGTPVIATNQFAIPELVDDGIDGILLDLPTSLLNTKTMPTKNDFQELIKPNLNTKTANELTDVLTKILNDQIDLLKLSRNAKKKFQNGQKFSIETRNKKLANIYHKALQ